MPWNLVKETVGSELETFFQFGASKPNAFWHSLPKGSWRRAFEELCTALVGMI